MAEGRADKDMVEGRADKQMAQATVRGTLRHDEPMARHVSWRAGGAAAIFFQPADLDDLRAFLRTLPAATSLLFVGLGSNLLVRDGGFDGAVILTHHALTGITEQGSTANALSVHAGAGVPSPHLARFAARHGGAGAEWLAGVPGTVGGALAMNAGCYGGETWSHVVRVETVDRAGELHVRRPGDYDLGYRHVQARGRDGDEEWFVGGVFRFERGDTSTAMERMKTLLARRVASQPLNQPNAGSVFRNPPGDHAARLIEACGLKGYSVGAAQVSLKHANFIVNLGGASAANLEAVMDHVHATVLAREGVDLEREVRVVGKAGANAWPRDEPSNANE